MAQIGTIAADSGGNHFAGLGMCADVARQGEQPQSDFQCDISGWHALRQRCALGFDRLLFLFFVCRDGFSELDIGAVRPFSQAHIEPGFRVSSQYDRAHGQERIALVLGIGAHRKLAGVFAFRIITASDEGAETAELQRQAAFLANRT